MTIKAIVAYYCDCIYILWKYAIPYRNSSDSAIPTERHTALVHNQTKECAPDFMNFIYQYVYIRFWNFRLHNRKYAYRSHNIISKTGTIIQ